MSSRILIIDDDEGILDGFQAMLESEGYEVMITRDSGYLSSLASKDYPDLIFLDVLLSGEDGREICKKLKEKEMTKKIPVIMMSAALDMEKSTKEACADEFLRKPFEMDEVLKLIQKYIP
jgi:DNA-binding response OmpR family regulator